jgi:Zn-finger nucleic acid-binding protein
MLVPSGEDGWSRLACTTCGGGMFATSDLQELIGRKQSSKTAGLDVVEKHVSGDRRCPDCGRPMLTANEKKTKTQIDWCGVHGVWLDAGEAEILNAARRQRGVVGSTVDALSWIGLLIGW